MSSIQKFVDKLKEAEGRSLADTLQPEFGKMIQSQNATSTSRAIEINLESMRRAGLLVPGDTRSQISEEYRLIKRPLLNNAFSNLTVTNGNMVMVTSAMPGEGKSFTAINLAMSIVMEMDRTALLIEADVVRPSFAQYLEFADEYEQKGLVDYLSDPSIPLEKLLLRTNIPKLSILPAGPNHPRSTELLAGQNMRDLCRDLANRYPDRMVIFDSPPLLISSEARVLASLVGQVVFVVAANYTPQALVDDALAKLDPKQAVGIVLNKCDEGGAAGYGYYGAKVA